MNRKHFLKQSAIIYGSILLPNNSNANSTDLEQNPLFQPPIEGVSAIDLHKALKNICGTSLVGCAVNSTWLINETAREIRKVANFISKTNKPTSIPKINAGIEIDTTKISLTAKNNVITLGGFSPTILLLEAQGQFRAYNELKVVFNPVKLKIDIDYSNNNKLRFFLFDGNASFTIPDIQNGGTNPNLAENVIIDNGMDKNQFLRFQELIMLSNNNMIQLLDGFAASIDFPKIIEAMNTFQIIPPYQYTFQDGYIFIFGTPGLSDGNCSCAGADGFRITTNLKNSIVPTQPGGDENGFSFEYTRTQTPLVVPDDRLKTVPDIDTPDFVYYYPQKVTFAPLVNNKLTPAISVGDEGGFLFFNWFYRASANIKTNFPKIIIDSVKKQMEVEAPFDIIGGAGVSIKIGCIYIPLLHSLLKGSIDNPSKLTITPTITVDSNGVAVYAKPDYSGKVDIQFFSPPMVDVLLNVIMGSFGNNLISKALRDKINSLNIKLIDFSITGIDSRLGWFYSTVADADSFLIALKKDLG